MMTRNELHQLVDELDEDPAREALEYLQSLRGTARAYPITEPAARSVRPPHLIDVKRNETHKRALVVPLKKRGSTTFG